MANIKPVKLGNNVRMSFAKINEVLDMPNLIEVQKNSYQWFLEEGLRDVFNDVSSITDYTGNLVLEFIDYRLDEEPKYTVEQCKERDVTYAAPLRVRARLLNKETGEIKESEVFMGDFPLMTESGTFVINGAERVIVSQLVRSPGVYFGMNYDTTGKMSVSTKTASCPSPFSCGPWAWDPTPSCWISSATTSGFTPPSRRISPRTPRKLCWRFTASCAPASR